MYRENFDLTVTKEGVPHVDNLFTIIDLFLSGVWGEHRLFLFSLYFSISILAEVILECFVSRLN